VKYLVAVAAALLLLLALTAVGAPYVFFEYYVARHAQTPAAGPAPARVAGRWADAYFVIEAVDETTFAIGEPRYYQGNYSYLLLGSERALLFDAGSGLQDITPVVRSLTSLPVTVLPSHLHFDHVGALGRFDRTALPDHADLRSRARDGRLQLERYEFLGAMDRLPLPAFRVDDWFADGQRIDLGGREVEILHTPGHTPTSVSVWDGAHRSLFVGDFLYPGELFAFLPGASLSAYEETANRLLTRLPAAARIYAAHMQEPPAVPTAPLMQVSELQALAMALRARREGASAASGFYPRIHRVSDRMTLATGFSWNLR
jgi:glyoxylase-like metal-dependent hydrolase (beta-lactamase superfamily II)